MFAPAISALPPSVAVVLGQRRSGCREARRAQRRVFYCPKTLVKTVHFSVRVVAVILTLQVGWAIFFAHALISKSYARGQKRLPTLQKLNYCNYLALA